MNKAAMLIGQKALKKLGNDQDKKHRAPNSDDPYHERVEVRNKNGKVTGYKTRKRPDIVGVSKHDNKILQRVRRRAYRWDMAFGCCCGFKFGWSSVIGILPVVGDFVDFLMGFYLIKVASKVEGGLPAILYGKMMANILWDLALGFVPVLGDFLDMWNRANTRNAWLLDAYLHAKADALRDGGIQDPKTGEGVPIPPEMRPDQEMEVGIGPARITEPAPVTPARYASTPRGNMAASSTPVTPGRNLTGGRADPRDNRRPKR